MRKFVRATVMLAAAGLCGLPASAALPEGPFPLGTPDLGEHRSSEEAAPGVTVYTIDRGWENPASPWTVSAGVARNARDRKREAACLRKAGLSARFQHYQTPGAHPHPYEEAVGGHFQDEKKAKALAGSVAGCGLRARAEAASSAYGAASWRLYAVEIKPSIFDGHLYASRGGGTLYDKQTTSAIAQHERALLAINGGFFTKNPDESMIGVSAGISVLDGRIVSGPTRRPYLLLRDGRPVSASIIDSSPQAVWLKWSDGSRTLVKGVNRKAGFVRGCGVEEQPVQDETCAVRDDLVAITVEAGKGAESASATNFILHPDGKLDLASTGEKGEVLLAATGHMIDVLSEKRGAGRKAWLDLGYGQKGNYAVNGAPLLLRKGAPVHEEDLEGWATKSVSQDRADFVHHWVNERNPRTAVGIAADGTIWFLVADGHEKANDGQGEKAAVEDNKSAGLTIEELRRVMHYLGAADAINLDGGGSSALVVQGKLVSHPSDAAGEREIGDAIVLTPGG